MSTRNFSIAAMSSYSMTKAAYASKSLALVDVCSGVSIARSGYRAYVMETSTNLVRQYNLAAPWDVTSSTGSYSANFPSSGPGKGMFVHPGGAAIIRYNTLTALLEMYTMSVPGEVSSIQPTPNWNLAVAEDTQPFDFTFSINGRILYILGFTNKRVYQYTLSAPFLVNTAIYSGKSLLVSGQEPAPYIVEINPTGTVMYIAGDNDTVYQYTLSTPFDLATAAYTGVSFSVAAQCVAVTGMVFKPDGLGFVLQGPAFAGAVSNLFQYNLT